MEPLIVCLWIFAGSCLVTWGLSLVTGEHSWVDRIWSVVPIAYLWVFACAAGFTDPRLNLIAALVTVWGARLTFNFARKGGYAPGGEDYRWSYLRSRMKPWQFALFNLLFITIYQNAILLLITLPALTVFEHGATRPGGVPLGWIDVFVAVVFLALLTGETIADQQQWNFHQWKKGEQRETSGPRERAATEHEPRARFLRTGLFRFSRHPNFFFEQAQWWVFFLFAVLAAESFWQWTVLGAMLLTLLFVGSTIFTESITRSRYPEYSEYQRSTSPIIPWFPRRRTEDAVKTQYSR